MFGVCYFEDDVGMASAPTERLPQSCFSNGHESRNLAHRRANWKEEYETQHISLTEGEITTTNMCTGRKKWTRVEK